MKSAVEFSEVIDSKIAKELALGRILGSFDVPPPVGFPFGASPQKDSEFRTIHPTTFS